MVDSRDMSGQLRKWVIAKDNPPSIAHVVLSAIAAVLSYLIARLFRLPEAYWAPMATLIVMQLTLNAALPIAVQYVVGTAVGAAVGAGPIFTSTQASGPSEQPLSSSDCCALHFASREARFDMQVSPS